jgi:O-acetyl-ADP-ribose deacetylase (regulator of RNase III)
MVEILIEQGDITTYNVSAIVNAANNDLLLGGGVAGAIARKGGDAIQEECNKIGPIKIGQAAITTGGRLPAKYVLHAASMRLGGTTTEDALKSSVVACLNLAERYQLETIAFPAIGTGIAGFPIRRCAEIMLKIFAEKSQMPTCLKKIYIVLFDSEAYNIFVGTQKHLES